MATKRPTEQDQREVLRRFLSGLAEGADAFELAESVKDFHPKKNGWLGFIIETEGVKIYHAGDTDVIPEMETFEVDIALLPVSGTYVMTADQAVKAAQIINPKLAIPMHFGAIVGNENDALRFKKALEGKIEVHILPKS